MRVAGLIFDDSRHYLDHLAPFCALLGAPLICCEPEMADLASRFYSDVETLLIPAAKLRLPRTTIACDPKPFLQAAFPGQSTNLLWLPHGNSDKGPSFEPLQGEIALVYGQRMIDFMGEQNVFPKTIRVGNFRWEYYRSAVRHSEAKTFLYAPTWDQSNTFWKALPLLADRLPADCRLWVKLHPNTLREFAPEVERMIGRYARANLQFLPNDPPIYPLLAQSSAYIGDMSSIGYDFLTLNRPMYFLNANPHLPLHRCGMAIDPAQFDFALQNPCAEAQKQLYAYTFSKEALWKEEINALCSL
ncbi:MAG: CDP-glycerol glycerophosphotransferase family protein [Verrucomicrobia bacterium]|nr:CDP-glycerol glycerophosphotransferase family protein [Verrucomicrobiota bacterium]MBU6446143.1 CDP-glycerol glycerophosphotransferase family protein [Verrucomicrobiota bacterium]MDE3046735.1 CDP-glycerol glycerophosphotransferase family protein [Verrucomicrobiota bacterium]